MAVLLIGALAVTGAQADPSTPISGARVATVLFLSYQGSGRPQFDPAALQTGCWDDLAARLHDLGLSAVTRLEMEPIVRRFGVRTSLSLSADFLEALAAEAGPEVLLVFDLIVYADRILLCGRAVRTGLGRVDWADLEELPVGAEAAAARERDLSLWRAPAKIASDRLLSKWRERPIHGDAGIGLSLLPVRTEGLEETTGRMVMACLLRCLMDSPWRIEDPGVTFSHLRQAGSDPGLLDRRSRPALSASGANLLLLSDIVAYEARIATPEREFREEAPAGPVTALPEAALSVRLIDGGSGTVRFAATEYLGMPPARGVFGMARSVSVIERVRPAADRLVNAARKKG